MQILTIIIGDFYTTTILFPIIRCDPDNALLVAKWNDSVTSSLTNSDNMTDDENDDRHSDVMPLIGLVVIEDWYHWTR